MLPIIAFGFTAGLVYFLRKIAQRYHLIDVPNARSSHEKPIPRGGGLGFVFSFLLGSIVLFFSHKISYTVLVAILGGGSLIALVGLWDDLGHVSASTRIFFHFIAAGWLLYLFHGMPALSLGFKIIHWHYWGITIGILGLVWLINFYNFMDGIDGLAGSETIFVSLAACLLLMLKGHTDQINIFLLLAACVAGFLIWNWSPAHIFMGDVGSGFLGYVFGVLLISTLNDNTLTPWHWLILLGCFWVDATLTLLLRVMRGEPPYQAHCTHAFQQAVKKTQCHERVVLIVMIINLLWLLPIALLTVIYPNQILWLTAIAILPLILLCAYLKAGVSDEVSKNNHHNIELIEGEEYCVRAK